jgi:hypothetical protein
LIKARAAAAGAVSLEVFSVDHDAAGTFAREAGVAAVLDRLRRAAAAGKTPPAMLLVGLYAEDDLRQRVALRAGAPGLFDWSGLSYLRFVFGEDELKCGIAMAVEGRYAPLPLPTSEELAIRAANIRHWLERVVNGLAGEATVFANAARGETGLSSAMLEPGFALSSVHCDNLAAFAAALRLAPAIADGDVLSKTLMEDVDAVCRESARLESVKASCPVAASAALADAAVSLSSAGQALDARMCAIAGRFAQKAQ